MKLSIPFLPELFLSFLTSHFTLTLIWVGFLGARFEVGNLITPLLHPPCLKLVRVMLETCVSTHSYVVSENMLFSTKSHLILLMSAFFCKKSALCSQNSTFTQTNIVRAALRFFSSVFSFCKIKGYCYWKYKFYRLCVWNPASRLLQIRHKLEKWQRCHNCPTWCHHQIFLTFFCFSCQV